MIIRILNEGQYEVSDAELDRLNALDTQLQQAVDANDEAAFAAELATLLNTVRGLGAEVGEDVLTSSDLVLPAADSSLAEVAELIGDEGLIPG
jgi:hypothetical protein